MFDGIYWVSISIFCPITTATTTYYTTDGSGVVYDVMFRHDGTVDCRFHDWTDS